LERATGQDFSASVAAVNPEDIGVVGRVVGEAEGKMSDTMLLLEGSIGRSDGTSVRLNLQRCPLFSLFPGQVIGVRGSNPSGLAFQAREIIHAPPVSLPPQHQDQTTATATATATATTTLSSSSSPQAGVVAPASAVDQFTCPADLSCTVLVASGPFTEPNNVEYKKLHAVLDKCRHLKPDMVILVGPFVDLHHQDVGSGGMVDSFEHVFKTKVLQPLSDFCTDPTNRDVVIRMMYTPRDATADPIIPQPRPHDDLFEDVNCHLNVKTMANPATIALGGEGRTLGATSGGGGGGGGGVAGALDRSLLDDADEEMAKSTGHGTGGGGGGPTGLVVSAVGYDVIKHLASLEINRGLGGGDRIARLAGHLVAQRCFYPIFPAPLDSVGADKDHDASVMVEHDSFLDLRMAVVPHILIAPSVFPPSAKPIEMPGPLNGQVLYVNPGSASRGHAVMLTLKKGTMNFMERLTFEQLAL